MISTMAYMFKEMFQWRRQIWHLAKADLMKTCRGAALGWVWLAIKPLTYIVVFWFALEIGLRAGNSSSEAPYILWLTTGIIPWFFMSDMLDIGSNVYKRYPYLVNRIPFPLPAISAFYGLSCFLVFCALILIVVILCPLLGFALDWHVIQLPFVALAMYAFWVFWSIMTSPLSAISKDFGNLIKALGTPIFWLSGIIYNVQALHIPVIEQLLAFNPVTFFATATRASVCDQYWIWERPEMLIPFVAVFVVTLIGATLCYGRFREEVTDVL